MSQLGFSDEQRQFRDFVARFFREQSPVTRARESMSSEAGYDPELWRRLGGELGLTGVRRRSRNAGCRHWRRQTSSARWPSPSPEAAGKPA